MKIKSKLILSNIMPHQKVSENTSKWRELEQDDDNQKFTNNTITSLLDKEGGEVTSQTAKDFIFLSQLKSMPNTKGLPNYFISWRSSCNKTKWY